MGEVVQFVPRPNPKRELRTLEQQAIEIIGQWLRGSPDDRTRYESSYLAPEKDPA